MMVPTMVESVVTNDGIRLFVELPIITPQSTFYLFYIIRTLDVVFYTWRDALRLVDTPLLFILNLGDYHVFFGRIKIYISGRILFFYGCRFVAHYYFWTRYIRISTIELRNLNYLFITVVIRKPLEIDILWLNRTVLGFQDILIFFAWLYKWGGFMHNFEYILIKKLFQFGELLAINSLNLKLSILVYL